MTDDVDLLVQELRRATPALIAIGGSAGCLEVLDLLLPALSPVCPPVAVVVHVPPDRPSQLAEVYGPRCAARVVEAGDKTPFEVGTVVFAPPDYHLLVERDRCFGLSLEEPVHYARPSIDVLLETAAWALGARVLGIVLSGANDDGAAGLAGISAAGGLAWVQDPASARFAEMPQAARPAATRTLAPRVMAEALARWTGGRVTSPAPAAPAR